MGSDRVCCIGGAPDWRCPLLYPEEGDPGPGARRQGRFVHARPHHLHAGADPRPGNRDSPARASDTNAHTRHCNRLIAIRKCHP